MLNNPLKLIDPTGHLYCSSDLESDECDFIINTYTKITRNAKGLDLRIKQPDYGNGGGGGLSDSDGDNGAINDIFEKIIHDDFQAMEDNNCFTYGPEIVDWTNSKCVDAMSLFTQDLATLTSSLSASWTAILTILGCTAEGVGCAAGYGLGVADHLMFFNPLETTFSSSSFALTVYSDLLTQDTYFNSLTDWGVGEDTKTGAATFAAGLAVVEPFVDAGIDTYASGYNHGYFCGISTVVACILGFP